MNTLKKFVLLTWYITGTIVVGIVFATACTTPPTEANPTGGAGGLAALIVLVVALTLTIEHIRQPQGRARLVSGGTVGVWGVLGAYLGCAGALATHPLDPSWLIMVGVLFGVCLFMGAILAYAFQAVRG